MARNTSTTRNAIILIVILALVADVILVARWLRYRDETERLRAGMTTAQIARADAVVQAEQHRMRIEFELIRRQARGDRALHLAVNVDSGRMVLERDGVVLRDMQVRIGPQRFRGPVGDTTIQVGALGQRIVERVLTARDAWELPADVFVERGLPVPENRRIRGALGERAILLRDGIVVYAPPAEGPLADPAYVLPGSVLMTASDLEALSVNIKPGMPVYFYK